MKFSIFLAGRLCVLCKQHEAKFIFRGRVKRDRHHNVCHRCYRSLQDSNAARQLLIALAREWSTSGRVVTSGAAQAEETWNALNTNGD